MTRLIWASWQKAHQTDPAQFFEQKVAEALAVVHYICRIVVLFDDFPSPPMRYWLLKSEPDVFSFDHLQQRTRKTEPWNGVRNYQARNSMRDDMKVGDLGLFYHSSCPLPGIAGIVKITREAYPDPTQFDAKSEYFDPKSTPEAPRWVMVDVTFEAAFKNFVSLEMLREDSSLGELIALRKGNRLSITPVESAHFKRICKLGGIRG